MNKEDYFDMLPTRESMRINYDKWGKNNRYHVVGGLYYWDIINNVLSKFENEHVNVAFSYYCTIVPKYQQHLFWEHVNFNSNLINYKITDVGIIKKQVKYTDKTVTFYSLDYEHEIEYYKDGHRIFSLGEYMYYQYYDSKKIVVTSGFSKTFTSSNDPEYKKLIKEKEQQIKKINRETEQTEYII